MINQIRRPCCQWEVPSMIQSYSMQRKFCVDQLQWIQFMNQRRYHQCRTYRDYFHKGSLERRVPSWQQRRRRHRYCTTTAMTTSTTNTECPSEIATKIHHHIQQQYNGNVMAWVQELDPNQQQRLLQSLRHADQSTTTAPVDTPPTNEVMTSINMANTAVAPTTEVVVVEPSARDLRLVTINMAIPFVGFGIMDNSILILAGDMIDTSLGVALGISTMCAAAIGNIISDIAGLMLGTAIEDFCANHLHLPVPNLSTAQRQLRSVRFASQWGCGLGVTIGCIIGMFPLMFIDSNKAQAKKREAHLDSIFRDVVTEAGSLVGAARTCLYLLVSPDDDSHTMMNNANASLMPVADGKWLVNKYDDKASASKGASGKERWIPLGRSIVSRAVLTGESLNIADVATEPDFVPDIGYVVEPSSLSDRNNAPVTRSMLCIPVMDSAGRPIAVIQAINKVGRGRDDEDDGSSILGSLTNEPRTFTENDVQMLKALASHISVSLQRMYEQAGGDEAEMRLKDTIHMLKKYGLAGLDDEHQNPTGRRSVKTVRQSLFPNDGSD